MADEESYISPADEMIAEKKRIKDQADKASRERKAALAKLQDKQKMKEIEKLRKLGKEDAAQKIEATLGKSASRIIGGRPAAIRPCGPPPVRLPAKLSKPTSVQGIVLTPHPAFKARPAPSTSRMPPNIVPSRLIGPPSIPALGRPSSSSTPMPSAARPSSLRSALREPDPRFRTPAPRRPPTPFAATQPKNPRASRAALHEPDPRFRTVTKPRPPPAAAGLPKTPGPPRDAMQTTAHRFRTTTKARPTFPQTSGPSGAALRGADSRSRGSVRGSRPGSSSAASVVTPSSSKRTFISTSRRSLPRITVSAPKMAATKPPIVTANLFLVPKNQFGTRTKPHSLPVRPQRPTGSAKVSTRPSAMPRTSQPQRPGTGSTRPGGPSAPRPTRSSALRGGAVAARVAAASRPSTTSSRITAGLPRTSGPVPKPAPAPATRPRSPRAARPTSASSAKVSAKSSMSARPAPAALVRPSRPIKPRPTKSSVMRSGAIAARAVTASGASTSRLARPSSGIKFRTSISRPSIAVSVTSSGPVYGPISRPLSYTSPKIQRVAQPRMPKMSLGAPPQLALIDASSRPSTSFQVAPAAVKHLPRSEKLGKSFAEELQAAPVTTADEPIAGTSKSRLQMPRPTIARKPTEAEIAKKRQIDAKALKLKKAESAAAMELIKKRQHEAKLKHETARNRAEKISAAKVELSKLGRGELDIKDVLKLVREENKDVNEAASAGDVVVSGADPADFARKRQIAMMRGTAKPPPKKSIPPNVEDIPEQIQVPALPAPVSADDDAEEMQPEAVARLLHTSQVTHTPVSAAPTVLAHNLFPEGFVTVGESVPVEGNEISVVPISGVEVRMSPTRAPSEMAALENALCDSTDLQGTEDDQRRRMDILRARVQEMFADAEDLPTLFCDQELFEGDEVFYVEEGRLAPPPLVRKYILKPQTAETRVQLRGSRPPSWFPGYYTILPQTVPPRIKLGRTASLVMDQAWRATQPDYYADDSRISV